MIDGVEEIVAVGCLMGTYVSIRPYTKQKKASRWDLGSIDRSDPPPWLVRLVRHEAEDHTGSYDGLVVIGWA